ncbi:MAG: hypothetical protein KC572_05770 [Gammaproteobacteria bacterium]|nr:hypothetical protein [Gammaproteobacteria bacterium]
MFAAPKTKSLLLFVFLAALAGCGSSGSDSGDGGTTPTNRAPIANAGAAQTVNEFAQVTLNGSGSSDPDGTTLTYSWTQQSGTSVTLSDASIAAPTFDAPDVTAVNTPEVLRFQLTVSDGSLSRSDTVEITVEDNGQGTNSPPTADAGPEQAVLELVTVNLDGTASSDPDPADTLSYAWNQTAGPNVPLTGSDSAQPSFTSPDVTAGSPVTLTFELAVNDGTDSATDTVNIVVSEGATQVTVAGKIQFEFVPPNANCRGLNFNAVQVRPSRGITVQLVDGNNDNNILDTTRTDANGDYAFSNVAANTDVRIRVRAELKRAGAPGWDVEVRDNVDTSLNPPPLGQRPLYVVQWAPFNTGGLNISDANFTAETGWGGSSYTGTRAAAPLAILDQVYTGMQSILAERPSEVFPPLDMFWSVNNTLTSPLNIDLGELTASFYSTGIDSLFLLGDANVDTEEFDDHVTMHEWGHYFEDNFSRSDSIGGPHTIGQRLDARLAFGEGFATAMAAIVLEEQQYCDTSAPITSAGFGLSTESENRGDQGWMNEMSVATFIYDLWDTDVDGTDNSSIGFGPILDTMIGPQANTNALTTLFSFSTALKSTLAGADLAFVNAQLGRENIERTTNDIWGASQNLITTAPNPGRDVLPLYTDMPTSGTINICTNSDYDTGRNGNKLAEHRFLRFVTTSTSRYNITVTATTPTPVTADPDDRDQSDPDIFIWRRGGLVALGNGPDENVETLTTQLLPADTYAVSLQEWRYQDEEGAPPDYPEQMCFDVTVTPN